MCHGMKRYVVLERDMPVWTSRLASRLNLVHLQTLIPASLAQSAEDLPRQFSNLVALPMDGNVLPSRVVQQPSLGPLMCNLQQFQRLKASGFILGVDAQHSNNYPLGKLSREYEAHRGGIQGT